MSSLLEKLMDRVGATAVPRYAKEALGYRARIQETSELKRIKDIPRLHVWQENSKEFLNKISETVTIHQKIQNGQMKLWIIQARALLIAYTYQGAFLPIGVGQGKALISLLVANEIKCKRPLLLVPAQLREQTNSFVIPEMKKHWKIHNNLRVVGYSELSLEKNANLLWEMLPDLIILDECHYLKNKKAGRTRRMNRYLKQFPNTKCVAMSGTISSRSLKDWAHIAEWCLHEKTPVPLHWNELMLWADCIDEKVKQESRVHPGALEFFCKQGENIRQGFRRRFVETPGIVASRKDELGVSLRILKKEIELPDKIKNMVRTMKATWETPQGDIITEAVDLWRHIRELSLGFWYKWDPLPPKDWLDARRAWKSYVRETLKHNRRNLDTELQVWNECSNHIPCDPHNRVSTDGLAAWIDWAKIKDTFKINTVAEWESDFALRACQMWLYDNHDCICWVEHREFGKELEKFCKIKAEFIWSNGNKDRLAEIPFSKYFGAGNDSILSTDNTRIIASIGAHSQGKNLQRFSKNLIACVPSSGLKWEQTLARTHRHGQEEDEVTCEMFLHLPELEDAFAQARADARYLEDTYGNRQKLNYADIVI